mmetsp:Transcript_21020/g.63211  ORF Transcript_21020/g.63211 Transcript_21020/m.63211 type:complete len:286 (+) Transcript_21020:48-905(+)
MRASTQQQRCVAIVDPISTGACVAVEATKRGYAVVAVWSAVVTKDLRNMVPEHAKGLRYHAQVDEGESIEATTQLLRKAAAPHKVDAVICGAETGVELADRLSQRSGLASNGTELGNRRDKHTQQQASRHTCLAYPPSPPSSPAAHPPNPPQAVREAGMRAVRETLGTEWQTVAGWVASELEANGKVVLPAARRLASGQRARSAPSRAADASRLPRPRSSSSQSRARARTASSCAPRWRSQRRTSRPSWARSAASARRAAPCCARSSSSAPSTSSTPSPRRASTR